MIIDEENREILSKISSNAEIYYIIAMIFVGISK